MLSTYTHTYPTFKLSNPVLLLQNCC